jgi:hypothetical protein
MHAEEGAGWKKGLAVEKTQRKVRDIGLCDGSAKGDFYPCRGSNNHERMNESVWVGLLIIFSFFNESMILS